MPTAGLAYFTAFRTESPARSRGCLTCTHFGRFYASRLLCERDQARYVVGAPAQGCAFWEREPGADGCRSAALADRAFCE